MAGNTERMARFIVETSYDALPKNGIEAAKQGIIDCLGVTLAACSEQGSRIIREYVKGEHGASESGVIAGGFKAPVSEAALANGTMAHMLDYDDISLTFGGHPSVALQPVALALGEKLHSSGKEVLESYIVGYEVVSSIGPVCFLPHYEIGWHTTATLGTIGAAAVAAKLLKLDADKSRIALGIAASLAGGLKRNFGTMTKPFHAGCAARNGIVAASLAQQGFTADGNIFDEAGNFCQAFGGGAEFDLEKTTQDLGKKFNICSGLGIKPYPSCGGTHAGIEGALQIRDKYSLKPSDIAEVEYNVSPTIATAVFRHQPQKGLEGKFSLEFCAALCFLDGKVTLAQFTDEKVRAPAVQDLISKTKVMASPEMAKTLLGAEIKVKLKNGEVLSRKVEAPTGSPENPLSQENLSAKFRDCASIALPSKEVDEVLELASGLESLEDIIILMEIPTFKAKQI